MLFIFSLTTVVIYVFKNLINRQINCYSFVTDNTLPLAITGAVLGPCVLVAANVALFKWIKGKKGQRVNGQRIKEAVEVYSDANVGPSKSCFINNSYIASEGLVKS